MFRPFEDLDGDFLKVVCGTKGGRPRSFQLTESWQMEVLECLRDFCRAGGTHSVGPNDRGLQASLARYEYVLHRIGISKTAAGVTGHGLRAEFACRTLESHGIEPPVRGGTGTSGDADFDKAAYLQVSNALGHSRTSVVGAYVGSRKAIQWTGDC